MSHSQIFKRKSLGQWLLIFSIKPTDFQGLNSSEEESFTTKHAIWFVLICLIDPAGYP